MRYSLRRITLGALLALVTVGFLLSRNEGHWRVMAAEQWLLTPWLDPDYMGDGGSALELLLCHPMGLAMDQRGELLISDRGRGRRGRLVWRVSADGTASVVAGTGKRGGASTGSALQSNFERPEGLAVAADGSILLSDGFNHAVYRIRQDGYLEYFAGTGMPGFSGDGALATEANLHRPADIRIDSDGNVFVADVRNHRIRKIDTEGRIWTVAGTGEQGFSEDGTLATEARLDTPWGIAIDHLGRLIIADSANHRVRRVEHDGRLTTIAGSGTQGFSGDGGAAVEASLNYPEGLTFAANGSFYVGDEFNHSVRYVDASGNISTVVGTGAPGMAPDGRPAHEAPLNEPQGILAVGDDLVVADGRNGRVLRISTSNSVSVIAGRGDIQSCADRW